jgi:hypothetical protein
LIAVGAGLIPLARLVSDANYNLIIELLFSLANKGAHLPRYHFVVTWRVRVREYGNTEGTFLQDEEEAGRFAARVINSVQLYAE